MKRVSRVLAIVTAVAVLTGGGALRAHHNEQRCGDEGGFSINTAGIVIHT